MLNENEVLDIMKNDLYQANERIKELEKCLKMVIGSSMNVDVKSSATHCPVKKSAIKQARWILDGGK